MAVQILPSVFLAKAEPREDAAGDVKVLSMARDSKSLGMLLPDAAHSFTPVSKYVPTRTTAMLEQLTSNIVHALNRRQFDDPEIMQHMDPNFKACLDNNRPRTETLSEYVEATREVTMRYPDYWGEIIDCIAHVDERMGRANVVFFARISGGADELKRQNFNVFRWRRRQRSWRCISHTSVRGGPGMLADCGLEWWEADESRQQQTLEVNADAEASGAKDHEVKEEENEEEDDPINAAELAESPPWFENSESELRGGE